MQPHIGRLIYKVALILTVFALILPAPVFAMPIDSERPSAPSATYTVDSIADDGSSGTLRWAITQANANIGADTIDFAIGTVGSHQTITLSATLPDITDPVVIDGWSQGGASYTGAPLIELNGEAAGAVNGLTLSGGNSIVRGLVINRFGSNGIAIFSANNKVQGNYIGTDASGASAQGNGGAGVLIYSGTGNVIGTDGDGTNDAAERNVISGNAYYGINLNGGDGNIVAGNFIGLNAAGTAAVGNLGAGITIFTSNNRIGTNADGVSDEAERNIVSGQIDNSGAGQPGFGIQTVNGGTGNVIAGNTIGLNAAGTAALGNPSAGVWLSSDGNLVGTNGDGVRDAVEGNVISANQMGIRFLYSHNNVAAGNFVGTDVTGVTAIPNAYWGVYFDGGGNNRLGTNGDGIGDAEERNIVSGNGHDGITFVGGSGNIVAGDYVGLNVNGDPLGNGGTGISIGNGAGNNRIGTDGSNDIYNVNEGNVIAANNGQGIQIFGNTSNNNVIAGNLIGGSPTSTVVITYPTLTLGLSPQNPSVPVNLPATITGTVYPGDRAWDKPTFASSYWAGSYPSGATSGGGWLSASSNGTWFYVDLGAPTPIHKIITNLYVDHNFTTTPRHYFITSNDLNTWQIVIDEVNTQNDGFERTLVLPADVTARYVGFYAANWSGGWAELERFAVFGPEATGAGNASTGVDIFQSSGNRVGTNSDGIADAEEANVIGGNGFTFFGGGVSIDEGNTNTIAGNFIGTDPSNTLDLGNNRSGIILHGGLQNTIGGDAATAGNIIRNGKNPYASGIELNGYNAQTTGNAVISNTISNNPLHGIDNYATETYPGSTAPGDGPADNTIISNTVTENGGYGIHDYGSSPEIRGNVIRYNQDSGIYNEVNFGNGADPATAGDDYLSRPFIISNTILGNCQKEMGCGGGIISVDTAPSNAATLEADNTPAYNIGPFIAQQWYGAAEVIQGGAPIASSVALDDNAGGSRILSYSTGPCSNLNNTIIHGDQYAVSCTDVTSWPQFMEYTVDESGMRTNYMPVTSTSPATAVYSFDADAATHPTDTGAGFVGEGITTGPFSRYQIMQVTIVVQPIVGLTAINDSPTILGNATNFTATVASGDSIVYSWNFGDGNTGTGQYPVHTYGALGYYTAIVTATNSVSTMTATTPVTITELPILNLAAINDSPTILGNATNFTATVTSGDSIVYSWDFGDGNTGTGQYPAHTYGVLGYYTAIVTATNSVSTMTATTPVTITELPILNLAAINDSPTILGNATNFTATVASGDSIVYSWDFGDGNTGTGQYPVHTYGALGYYTAIVTATNSVSTMTATTPVTITELPILNLAAINNSPTILGNATNFTATVTSGDSIVYSWNFGDGNTGTGQYPVHTYGALGYYTAIVTAANSVSTLTAMTPVTITASCTSGLVVENTNDGGCGSLRYAVGLAQSGNTVTFTPTLAGQTIILTSGQINIDQSITIDGAGAPDVAIDGNHAFRIFEIGTMDDITVTLNALNIVNGSADFEGGGVLNYANLIVTQCDFINNAAISVQGPSYGGGLSNLGAAQISASVFLSNTASRGGGIYNASIATVRASHPAQRQPTWVVVDMEIVNTTLSGNRAIDVEIGAGGGIYNDGPLTINTSTLYSNTAASGGGIYNYGQLAVSQSTFSENRADYDGGGVYNRGLFSASQSTFSGNAAVYAGGGLYNAFNSVSTSAAEREPGRPTAVDMEIVNSTLSGNRVTNVEGGGGGIYNNGPLTVLNSTFYTNTAVSESGGGLFNQEGADLSFANTVIAHSAGGDCLNWGNINSNANNLIEDESCNVDFSGDPLLGPLADNGGPTLTHLPLTASPLIDMGDNDSAAALTYDQRGPGFPRVASGTVDIGAVEVAAQPPTLTAINDSPTLLGTTTNLTATLTGVMSAPTFTWAFGDGLGGTGQSVAHTYAAFGLYTAIVTAANGVITVTATTLVTITEPPLLNLVASNDSPTPLGNTTNLLASVQDNSATFTWAFGDGTTGTGQSTSHIYGAVGFYTAIVTATNSVGMLTTTTRVTITDQPILNLTAINDSPTVLGNTTHLTATATGSNIFYTWAFGDGTTGVGQTPTHVYTATGMYTAVVTATNSISTVTATTPVTIGQPKHYTTYLPLITSNFFTAPELIVQSVAASSDVITVVIKNIGDAPAAQAFWIDAYVDPNPPPTAVNQIWWDQNRSEQGVAWAVDEPLVPFEPGTVITLTSRDPNVSPVRTFFLGNLPAGTPIYAQVDSYNYQTDYGAVQERQEILGLPYNNILGPAYSTPGTTPLAKRVDRLITNQFKSTLPYRPARP
jgi:PKD repeat protein